MNAWRFVILGCGSSGGVPRIGDDWGACDPAEPRNRRTRCSGLVERHDPAAGGVTRILIDTAPELRLQVIGRKLRHLDAVFFTHDHADQSHGIDDLRQFAMLQRRRIAVYMDREGAATLTRRFAYCFEGEGDYPPILEAHITLKAGRFQTIAGTGGSITALPIQLDHGTCGSLGFRFGDLAYVNDVVEIPEPSLAALAGVKTLIVDALRYRPHPTHAHVDKALAWARALQVERVILTNLHVDLDYHTLKRELPDFAEPAYDGMTLDFAGDAPIPGG